MRGPDAASSRHENVKGPISILLPHLHSGGAERVSVNLANEFVSRGFTVDMVLMRAAGDMASLLDSRVRVVDLKAGRILGSILPLKRYLTDTRPGCMLACMWPLTIAAIVANLMSGHITRVVVAEHSSWSASERSHARLHRTMLGLTTRLLYRHTAGVVAVSNGVASEVACLASLPPERVTAIYNPISGGRVVPNLQSATVPEAWAKGAHAKVLAVGRLKPIKDYPNLLSAFALLQRSVDARLLILGDGSDRDRLEAIVRDLGIKDHVLMPGFSSDPAPFYRVADLLVLSSTGEGFGNVLVEALEEGTPVVSTDCPSGPREILDNGRFGLLVPVGDSEALANAMKDSLGRSHDVAALRARAADFSVQKAADAYLDVLLPNWRQWLRVPVPFLEEG